MKQWVCKVDRDGRWAVGKPDGPVLASSAELPRDDRQPVEYDLEHDTLNDAEIHARALGLTYRSGLH